MAFDLADQVFRKEQKWALPQLFHRIKHIPV